MSANDLFETNRLRAAEVAAGNVTVARVIEWMVEPQRDGMLLSAASFNADGEALDHKQWTIPNINEAFTRVAEWKREIQLAQSNHSIIVKRIAP